MKDFYFTGSLKLYNYCLEEHKTAVPTADCNNESNHVVLIKITVIASSTKGLLA